MQRMQALRLMPSHTFFYQKLSQYGKDYDADILKDVELEGKRRTALIRKEQLKSEEDITNKKMPEEMLNSEVFIADYGYSQFKSSKFVNETTCWKQAVRIVPAFRGMSKVQNYIPGYCFVRSKYTALVVLLKYSKRYDPDKIPVIPQC